MTVTILLPRHPVDHRVERQVGKRMRDIRFYNTAAWYRYDCMARRLYMCRYTGQVFPPGLGKRKKKGVKHPRPGMGVCIYIYFELYTVEQYIHIMIMDGLNTLHVSWNLVAAGRAYALHTRDHSSVVLSPCEEGICGVFSKSPAEVPWRAYIHRTADNLSSCLLRIQLLFFSPNYLKFCHS